MGTLAVDNIQHTDGSSAVTLNNAGITNLSAGTIGSGVTGGAGLNAVPSPFALSAAQAQTGGNAKAFTGIPSWHRHIYLFINRLSFSDGADIIMQLGYGSTTYQTSGYISTQTNAVAPLTCAIAV